MKFKDKTETYKDKVDCSWKLSAISSSRAKSALSTQKRSHLKQASFCSVDSAHKREVKKTTFPTHYTNRTQ